MYRRIDQTTGQVSDEFVDGLRQFMEFAQMQQICRESGKIFCPCTKCANERMRSPEVVCRHIYDRGFVSEYYIWGFHGEDPTLRTTGTDYGSSVTHAASTGLDTTTVYETSGNEETSTNPYVDMVADAFHGGFDRTTEDEVPNPEAKRFFDMLQSANQPIYEGCREGHSRLALAARMLHTKTDYNVGENCMDSFCQTMYEYLPQPNHAPKSYYETKAIVKELGMPVVKIDVCRNNCMLYWGQDENLTVCKFCRQNRFRTKNPTRKKLTPYKKMFYMPLANRLQRLYESQKTAPHISWHADHATTPGEMQHPSDGKAWKDFNKVFPNFASEPRNVYLCLCTDGFAPYGQSGKQYSLWPVIMSPYNFPPEMCLKREVMFLTLLIPGPDHPKKSFDVFLQPLIKELTDLWNIGVPAFDVSRKQNFTLKAVLLWTISDFPAYGMLSGWSTHGALACPYCMDETDSFRLEHGRKPCW